MQNQLCSIAYDLKLPGDACCICCCAHWCWFSGWARTSWCSLMLEAIATASTCTAMTPDHSIIFTKNMIPGLESNRTVVAWNDLGSCGALDLLFARKHPSDKHPKREEREKNREKTWYVNTYVYNVRFNRYISYISEKCRIVKYSIV